MPRMTAGKRSELESFWRAHLDGWRRSDLNQREYCELHGLPPHYTTQLLRAWESDGLRDSILQMESPDEPPSSRRSRAHAIVSP